MLSAWVAVLSSIAFVLGNAEVFIFAVEEKCMRESSTENLRKARSIGPIEDTLRYLNNSEQASTEVELPPDIACGDYFARICWPASQPSDFNVEYIDNKIIVEATRSDVVSLQETKLSPSVSFSLHISKMVHYGLTESSQISIPSDLQQTVIILIVLTISTLWACYALLF